MTVTMLLMRTVVMVVVVVVVVMVVMSKRAMTAMGRTKVDDGWYQDISKARDKLERT